ncbi:uncharacterized protein [Periplaneta americana]|uniref:uncharacterized protein n=1 Tax=Periplaneta americana TaxID=6978 RepID=UPI0037E7B47F
MAEGASKDEWDVCSLDGADDEGMLYKIFQDDGEDGLLHYSAFLSALHWSEYSEIPTFSVDDILPDNCCSDSECELSDNDDDDSDDDDEQEKVCFDMTEGYSTVHLPILQLNEIYAKAHEKYASGMKGHVYKNLPSYLREAVMQTNELNDSLDDFFKNSQWYMYLRWKRSQGMQRRYQTKKKRDRKRTTSERD